MLIQISPEFTPTTWSAVTARPTCAPTLRTPSTERSSTVARDVIRFISGRDVPGVAFHRLMSSVSLIFSPMTS